MQEQELILLMENDQTPFVTDMIIRHTEIE